MASNFSPLGRESGNNLLDRSKVRVLLCDNDVKSSQEVIELLHKCSYQVTSVRTARQVIDALNAEGQDIDIILTEVDLPIAKGLKMLKYIMRQKELRRIPIIMMSAQDEVSVVFKCLRLGAADYLVKPLRTNELLNLWTHMWRRRRLLGLAEKNILSNDFDLVASDPSDANTNSTTLFSDDTDEKSRRSAPQETSMTNQHHNECHAPSVVESLSHLQPDTSEPQGDHVTELSGVILSQPKKSKLKIGQSSAFFTYVKSSVPTSDPPRVCQVDEIVLLNSEAKLPISLTLEPTAERPGDAGESCSHGNSFTSCENVNEASTSGRSSVSALSEYQGWNLSREHLFSVQLQSNSEGQPSLPACFSGMPNQIMMHSSGQMFQGNPHDIPKHVTPGTLPQYNSIPHCSHVPMMTPMPYYPISIAHQPGQMHAPQMWQPMARSSSPEVKSSRVERREAALIKFRQKRKDRCFEKKIRYVNRKKLAEKRPRVRGQFARQLSGGVDVDLNGQPFASADSDEDEQEDEEDEEDA